MYSTQLNTQSGCGNEHKGGHMAFQRIRTVSLLSPIGAALIFLAATATNTFAGKDHCRTLTLDGSAGETSTDSVVFRMVDETGADVIDESCQITVQSSEDAEDFGERLPVQWYTDDLTIAAPPCATDAEALALATKPNGKIKYPKKVCSTGIGSGSCKIKFTYKVKKSTGEVKKGPQLDICCWETPDCKGTKWGKGSEDDPINLQVRNNNVSLSFLPAEESLPAAIGATSDLVVDPIGMEQRPDPGIQDCRKVITGSTDKLANKMYSVLRACHLAPGVPDHSVCNTISPASDPDGDVSAAVTSLRDDAREACASLGSPSKLSFTECPAPCGGIINGPKCVGGPNDGVSCRIDSECDSERRCAAGVLGPPCSDDNDCSVSGICLDHGFCAGPLCSIDSDCDAAPGDGKCVRKGDGVCKDRCSAPAATFGDTCAVDEDCDSAPSAGDGRCGDWGEVSDCSSCLVRAAVESTMATLTGPTGTPLGGLSPEGLDCKEFLLKSVATLQKVELKETSTCQKLVDKGKIALPDGVGKCKDADRKGKRALAASKFQNALLDGKGCFPGSIGELDTCGNDATTLGICAVAAVNDVNEAYSTAAIPESRCGDNKRIGEECDDGNNTAGDGCAADCTCEGTCGDGSLNPLEVCGELCDDGNTVNGDGCDNNCTPTGCGNGIITAGEDCESDSDCAVGQTCNSCMCVGPGGACPAFLDLSVNAGHAGGDTSHDLGWTGWHHATDSPDGAGIRLGLDCDPGCMSCTVTGIDPARGNCRCSNSTDNVCTTPLAAAAECGGAQCDCYTSPPQPVVAAGVPLCSLPRLGANVSGTWSPGLGAGALNIDEFSAVYVGIDVGQPCPVCVGDPVANDGVLGGTCSGGPSNGSGCDVNATDPAFGDVSYNCLPDSGSNITGVGLRIKRTDTTGSFSLPAGLTCSPPLSGLDCPCAVCSLDNTIACSSDTDCSSVGAGTCSAVGSGVPTQPNDCSSDALVCSDGGAGIQGFCSSSTDTYCDGHTDANGRFLLPCSIQADCDALDAECSGGDCGLCAAAVQRSCFLGSITVAGQASAPAPDGSGNPDLGSVFCVPPTASAAANTAIGLPGPARLVTDHDSQLVCSDGVTPFDWPGGSNCP